MLSITVGQNRPHLGLCLGHNVPLQGRQGSRGCIPNSPGESGLVSREAKDSALLSSRTGYFLDPTEWPKGSQSSCEVWREDQGLLSRSGRKRSPQSRDDGGFSRAAAPVWGFSRGMTGSSGSTVVYKFVVAQFFPAKSQDIWDSPSTGQLCWL